MDDGMCRITDLIQFANGIQPLSAGGKAEWHLWPRQPNVPKVASVLLSIQVFFFFSSWLTNLDEMICRKGFSFPNLHKNPYLIFNLTTSPRTSWEMLLKGWTKCIKNGQLFFIASKKYWAVHFTLDINPLHFTAFVSQIILLASSKIFDVFLSTFMYKLCSTPFCCRMHMRYHGTRMGVWSRTARALDLAATVSAKTSDQYFSRFLWWWHTIGKFKDKEQVTVVSLYHDCT